MREERRLVSLRRRVSTAREEAYRSLWDDLATAVTESGGHAWRFVAETDPELRLEFLEFKAAADPRRSGDVTYLLDRLGREVGRAETEEWLESR